MKVLSIQVLRGPNVWSINKKKLIQMRLDLEDMEERPTNTIAGFKERIEKLIPSLFTHHCSPGHEGGFFLRVEEGTWMGHVIEHIALEIQTLAGMDVGFGRTRSTYTTGVYQVVFSYVEESVGIYAAEAAVKIAEALIKGEQYDLESDILTMRKMRERERYGPSTGSIVDEAIKRDIPYLRLGTGSLVQLGYGKNQVRFHATMTDKTSSIAVDIAGNKEATKTILKDRAIPVADGMTINNADELEEAIERIGFPLVIKPLNGCQGKGASVNVNDRAHAEQALAHAQKYSQKVIVEKFVTGSDFRALVINNKMVAAALRIPAHVTGDGILTIQQLIDKENQDPRRGIGHENVLTEIKVDHDTIDLLNRKAYTLETVPAAGEVVDLKSTANLSTGGTSIDITEQVHPQNIFIFERIATIIGLNICGIDIMAQNLREPLSETGGIILEVNASPGFRMHLAPSEGVPRNVAAPVLDMLYPPGKSCRIPIIAVTGTNGKTTTTRLIAHIVKDNGYRVGYTTSDGVYIQNSMMMEGDTTGPVSAEFILKDPTVEFAVLETARGGILRSGLGFPACDIGVLTNIQEDHLGIDDIHTLEDLARVKSVLIEAVKPDGWAVINADDEYCIKIAEAAKCNVAYFSMREDNPVIVEHGKKGLTVAVFENGFISIKRGDWKIRIERVTHVPITFNGAVPFMIQNALAATLTAFLWGFKIDDIRSGLATFAPSTAHTPGRMNIFRFKDYRILVDYAHNPQGLRGVQTFLKTIDARHFTGVIAGTGDRRDEDIKEMGRLSAMMFDDIVICQEGYLRGRSYENLTGLLIDGMKEIKPDVSYAVINNGHDALQFVLSKSGPGDFITIISNAISLETVKELQDKEAAGIK